MLQVLNGGLGPLVFRQIEPTISGFLQRLATHVESQDQNWSVKILRPFNKPATMGNDKPFALRPERNGETVFLVCGNKGGSAFECTVEGISREDLGIAFDHLHLARGKAKKSKLDKLEEVVGKTEIVSDPNEAQTASNSCIIPTENAVSTAISAALSDASPNELKELALFMDDVWKHYAVRVVDGYFFVFNHELSPLIRQHFQLSHRKLSQFYAVRLFPFGQKVKTSCNDTDGWKLDLAKVEAFIEGKTGVPKRVVARCTINLPPQSQDGADSARFPELAEPASPPEAEHEGTLDIVLTGEQLAAKLDAAKGLDVDLISKAASLVAEHAAHKANAITIELGIQDLEAARNSLERELGDLLAKVSAMEERIVAAQQSIANACGRLVVAKREIERTRIPQPMLEKLDDMRKQLDVLFAAISKQTQVLEVVAK